MEPRGGKGWQLLANPKRPKTAKVNETVAVRCDHLPFKAHGKECHEEGPPAE
jgi:hypothetical protein